MPLTTHGGTASAAALAFDDSQLTDTDEPFTIGDISWCSPSGDMTGATDSATIAAALSAGQVLVLLPGNWYVDGPIVLPDQGCMSGVNPSWGIPSGDYGVTGLPLQGAIIQAGSSFSGTALISIGSAGTLQHGGQRLYGITLSGNTTPAPPAGTHGIYAQGYVGGVKMRDVVVWKMPGDGLHADWDGTSGHNPDFWQLDSCKFSGCGGYGAYLRGLSDSWFTACEATGNTTGGWWILDGADSRYIGCRGSSNVSGPGWTLTTNGGFASVLSLIACEANFNGTYGIEVTGANSSKGTILLDSLRMASNPNNPTPLWSYSGSQAIRSNAAWSTSTSAPTYLPTLTS